MRNNIVCNGSIQEGKAGAVFTEDSIPFDSYCEECFKETGMHICTACMIPITSNDGTLDHMDI